MPFPDHKILYRFLDDYAEIRTPDWHSYSSAALRLSTQLISSSAQAISKLSSIFLNAAEPATHVEEKSEEQNDETFIKGICVALKTAIGKARTTKDWAKIAFDLGEEARRAMKRSYRKNSLFCQTLHAMRTYIIENLRHEHLTEYKAIIAELNAEKQTYIIRIEEEQLANLSIEDSNTKLTAILYQLADLGDERAIFECARRGMFLTLPFPEKQAVHQLAHSHQLSTQEVNIHMPWYYQKNYYLRYLAQVISKIKMESWTDFTIRARSNGKLIATSTEREAVTAVLLAEDLGISPPIEHSAPRDIPTSSRSGHRVNPPSPRKRPTSLQLSASPLTPAPTSTSMQKANAPEAEEDQGVDPHPQDGNEGIMENLETKTEETNTPHNNSLEETANSTADAPQNEETEEAQMSSSDSNSTTKKKKKGGKRPNAGMWKPRDETKKETSSTHLKTASKPNSPTVPGSP